MTFGAGKSDAVMADNAEWLTKLNYIEMLRDVGRHFSINRMLTMDSVKLRLDREQELSFIEFNYMILQSYDFVELARRYGCNLQMGGSDQWGNIVNGIDLGRRMGNASALRAHLPAADHVVGRQDGQDRGRRGVAQCRHAAAPTTTGSSGATPRTATSSASSSCSRMLPLAEIARLAALKGQEINEAKKVLATEATALVHGRAAAEAGRRDRAHAPSRKARSPRRLPTVEVPRAELEAGLGVLTAFAEKTGLVASNGEARRQIKGGGLRVNDAAVDRREDDADLKDLTPEGVIKLSLGRKKHVLLKPV